MPLARIATRALEAMWAGGSTSYEFYLASRVSSSSRAGSFVTLGIRQTASSNIAFITPGSLPAAEAASVSSTMAHIAAGTKPVGNLANKWWSTFKNWGGDLPGAQGAASPYREFRVAPSAGATGAGTNRIVVNVQTGEAYYTWTHYGDTAQPAFVRIR